ncbi:MAG: hypothetical protein E2O57_02520, partial [Gammaproteobacteria bacterium]
MSLLLGACTTFQAEVAETAVPVQAVVEAEVRVPAANIEVISPHDSNPIFSADYFDFSLPDNILVKSPFVGSAQPELAEIVDRRKINLASSMAQIRESIVLQRRQAAALQAFAELEKNN